METTIFDTKQSPRQKLLIGTPTLGIVRFEWCAARWGQIIPCNWQTGHLPIAMPGVYHIDSSGVLGCLVADAQNVIVQEVIDKGYEWLFLHEDDVLLPPDMFLRMNEYMRAEEVPVVSGLYYTKSEPSEPVVYRGRGNSFYGNWKRGDEVWVDGVPTGCLLIHASILEAMHADAEEYIVTFPGMHKKVKRVFESPRRQWTDPETGYSHSNLGTSDLFWCDNVIKGGYLKKAGWGKIAKRKYPFLLDTNMFCRHIDLNSGRQYPATTCN
jgi:hypothetical protein